MDKERALIDAIKTRIADFDGAYSRFRDDSLVARISRAAGEYRLPDDAAPMIALYREIYDLTGGLVTPLIGRTLSDAGYDAAYTLRPKADIARPKRWEDVMEYEHPILRVKEPVLLDFGALGKGYLIDIVAGIIRERGIDVYTVDAGGDMAYRGAHPLRVGLEDPADSKKALGIAYVSSGQSVCGSAGNRRAWDRFHHIMDPRTAESPRHIAGLWVVADTTMLADAISTALFFVGPERLSKYSFEYAIVFADRSAVKSARFAGEFFGA